VAINSWFELRVADVQGSFDRISEIFVEESGVKALTAARYCM
jgi:hypothetical protein